jgi:hypothetical protein
MDRKDVAQCRHEACLQMEQGGGRRALRIVTVIAVALVATIALSATPVSAQSPTAAPSVIQGGPFGGISVDPKGILPEFGFRLGKQRGTRVLDLSVSAYRIQYLLPIIQRWGFESLVGLNWQPGPLELGFRSGFGILSTVLGDRHTYGVYGPHAALIIPAGPSFRIRSEAGAHLIFSRTSAGAQRAYIRVGLEVRR